MGESFANIFMKNFVCLLKKPSWKREMVKKRKTTGQMTTKKKKKNHIGADEHTFKIWNKSIEKIDKVYSKSTLKFQEWYRWRCLGDLAVNLEHLCMLSLWLTLHMLGFSKEARL